MFFSLVARPRRVTGKPPLTTVSIEDRYTFDFSEPIRPSALSDSTTEANANLSPDGSTGNATDELFKQLSDVAEFFNAAGGGDGVAPPTGSRTLKSYYEELAPLLK